jgi:hypothetical protein
MTGKHRKPRASTGRNLAATAAVLTAGALPLAAAGSAWADAAPAAGAAPAAVALTGEPGLQQLAAPVQAALPLAEPLREAAPLAGAVADDLRGSVASGNLPGAGLAGTADPQLQSRDAAVDRQTAIESGYLAGDATQLAGQVTPALPMHSALAQVAPAMAGQSGQGLTPLLKKDDLVAMNGDFAAHASALTNKVSDRMQPTVQELRGEGVPSVGDVTSRVGSAKVPLFGTVGGLTAAMPVGQTLGDASPVIGAVNAASGL